MPEREKFTCKCRKCLRLNISYILIACVAFRLYNLEPDQSVTGGAWYSDQDFESEFVEILNQQCSRFLESKLDTAKKSKAGPLVARNLSIASLDEVHKFIADLVSSLVFLC